MDLSKGFWQVPLTARASELSAFATPDGLYQCRYMPFGRRNSPATFQRLMNKVIESVPGCVVYVDDIVLYSDSWSHHRAQLGKLLAALAGAGLVVNLKKCSFGKAAVEYLGHTVGSCRVKPCSAKIEAIMGLEQQKGHRNQCWRLHSLIDRSP